MAGTAEVDRMVVRLVGDTGQYVQSMKGAAKATQKFTRDASGRLRAANGQFLAGSKLMRAELSLANGSLAKASVVLKHYSTQLLTAGTAMRTMGRTLFVRLTLPLSLLGGFAARSFAKFDQAMVESTSIMKVTQEQTERMRQTAISLSGDSAKSATDLAESYFFLASAGKDAEQSMSLLPKVMDFAIAGAFDMATATDLLTDAQSALGLTSKDIATDTENMGRVSDVLVKANTLANASVQQFAIALTSKAGSSLKAFSKDVEEGVAVLAAFADQGVKAQLAGNQLDRVIRLLSKSSMDNAKQHKQLGFEVFDAQGKMRNMGDIVGNLEDILEGMSDQTKVATLDMLGFEARVQQAILPLLGTSEAIKKYEKELRKAKGITAEIANKQMQSFNNQMKVAWNNVKNLASGIGETLAPTLLTLGNQVKGLPKGWDDLGDSTKSWIVTLGLLAAATGPVLIGLGSILTLIGSIHTKLFAMSVPTLAIVALAAAFVKLRMDVASANLEIDKAIEKTQTRFETRVTTLETLPNEGERKQAIEQAIENQQTQIDAAQSRLAAGPKMEMAPRSFDNFGVAYRRVAKAITGADPLSPLRKDLKQAKDEMDLLLAAQQKLLSPEKGIKPPEDKSSETSNLLAEAEKLAIRQESEAALLKSGETMLANLKLQTETVGMTSDIAAIYALEQQGITKELAEQLRVQNELLNAEKKKHSETEKIEKEAEAQQKNAIKRIEDLTKAHRTPAEKFRALIEDLKMLNSMGLSEAIAVAELRKGFKEFQSASGLDKEDKKELETPRRSVLKGITVGSRESFELMAQLNGGDKKENTAEKTLTTLEQIKVILEEQEKLELELEPADIG